MRAARQTYAGRVIFPAKYHEAKRPFITFVLYVDGHLVSGNERKSAKISCNYSLPEKAESDMVAVILSRVFSKDDPDNGGLAGEQYKSVDVLVEGEERLVEVEAGKTAVYKNLDFCRVTIVDKHVRGLFNKEFNSNGEDKDNEETETQVERPNTTPSAKSNGSVKAKAATSTSKSQAPKTQTQGYQVGDIVQHGSKKYRYIGGAVNNTKSWEEVVEEEETDTGVPPFMAGEEEETSAPQKSVKSDGKPKSSLRRVIQGEDSDMEFTQTENPV